MLWEVWFSLDRKTSGLGKRFESFDEAVEALEAASGKTLEVGEYCFGAIDMLYRSKKNGKRYAAGGILCIEREILRSYEWDLRILRDSHPPADDSIDYEMGDAGYIAAW
jgi:hypothetical protein